MNTRISGKHGKSTLDSEVPEATHDNRALIILGMHRSGTSVLSGTLSQAGVNLGTTFQPAFDNPKGNQESPRIMALQEDILQRNGGSWNAPVNPSHWSPVHRELRDAIIESHGHDNIWGFKDPRTLYTLQGWLSVLPEAELTGIFRHPFLVAESLQKRNEFTLEFGLNLWTLYNRVLLWYLDRFPRMYLLEFSTDEQYFLDQTQLLINELKLTPNPDQFFEPALRRSDVPPLHELKGASSALTLYEKLCNHQNHHCFQLLQTDSGTSRQSVKQYG